jgi:PAS domain S-box-containing protein
MHSSRPSCGSSGRLLTLSAKLNGAETVETAVARATDLVETVFDQPVVRVCAYDPATESVTTLSSSSGGDNVPDRIPEPLAERLGGRGNDVSAGDAPDATVDTDPPDPLQAEALVPVGRDRVLRVGVTGSDGLSTVDSTVIQGIAANLEATLSRIDHRRSAAVDCDVARAVFDRSGDATFVSDTDGTLVAVNRAAVELTGRDRETLLSAELPDVSGEAAAEPVRAHLDRAATDASDPLTTTLEHARDGDLTVELTSQRIRVDGTSYLHTVADDLSSDAQPRRGPPDSPAENDVTALRRLNELTAGVEAFDETIERLLSLGCDHFGLDTGVLSRVDGDDYEVEAVVDATDTHEQGAVYDRGNTMCDVTLAAPTEPLAFADVATTDHRTHPAAKTVRAYIAAPVSVGGETYGTVNFSMGEPRSEAFRPEHKEFVTLIAGWIGTELDRRRRVEELERYETILDAVDDPVYALDADWRFTFANEAAEREFGDGEKLIGRHPSVGIDDSDVDRMQKEAERLLAADERSTAVEFELETADGGHKTVENRLGLIGAGDGEFRGTAGVLRDVTVRNERQRQLEAFQQAIEKAVDGVAILDNEEYTYVDRTHVDMYGFENETQLLGNTWRALYDDDEIERLEAEAFPALESDGYWRGTVTGSRPDGSTFPAELSLTTIDDGRLVCTVRDETERRERERELNLKERAMDEATVSIQITDPTAEDTPLVYVNDGFERMTGYARENALGRNPRFLHGRDTDPERLARLREAVATGEPVSLELRTERKDGTPYWSRISLTPITDESGAVENVIRIQQDVTERKERERRTAARSDFLKRIYELTTDPERTFDEKITGLLQAGRDHLDLPYGFLTRIERDDHAGAGTQTVVEALGSHERLQPGASAPLERSYCRRTIAQDRPMALTHATEAGWADDVAYETFGLETYIGGEIVAGDDLYGTLCFASEKPRDRPFDGFERSFIRLVGRWIGYEIDRRDAQAKLQDQRERLELTLSGTDTGIVEWDPETDTVEWNETLVELVGREVESIEALNAAIHPDDRDRVQRRLEAMVETGDSWTGEFRVRDDTGDVVWLGTRATPVSENGDKPVTVLATVSDISDRKRTERERRRNERRFESLFDDPGMLVGLLDTDGLLLDANETAMGYVDATPGELRGEPFWETPWWDRSEEQQAALREWVQRAADGEYVEYAATHPGPDGDPRDVAGTVRPVADDSGTVRSLLITGRDVTERERGRRTLRNRQRRLRALHGSTQKLLRANSKEDAAAIAVESLSAAFDFQQSALYFRRDDALVSTAMTGTSDADPPDRIERGRTPLWDVVETGDPVWYDDCGAIDDGVDRGSIVSSAYFPVGDHGAVAVGVTDSDRLDESERKLVEVLTGNLASVLDTIERQRELFEERERFRLLTESVDEYAFLVVDEDGVIRTWNNSAAQTFGYDADAAVGMSMAKLHPEADRESRLPDRLLQQAQIAGESAHEGRRVREDGSTFYADVRYAPLETDDDSGGYAAIVRDMTDRRRERRRTEQFVEESDDVVTIVDTDGTVRYASGSATRVLGYDPADLVGKNLFDYLHPDARERAMETFFRGIEEPGGRFQIECRFRSGDDEWLNAEGRGRNMLDDDAIDGMLLYLRDVTENKKRARRFESIFNQTFQFTGLLAPDGTVLEANDATLEFGGVERDNVVGASIVDAPWWTHSKTVRNDVVDAIERAASGEFVRYQTEARGADGLAVIDFSVKPVTDDDDEVSMLVAEGRDITAQQQHKRHLEVMQRVMRHNMRNDLTKIRGWTRMIAEETEAEKRAERFEIVERILDKWASMTEKMREIRTVLGSPQERRAEREAGALLKEAVAPVRAEYDGVTVVTDVSDTESKLPATLLDAVRELAENAAEASAEPTIEVELDRSADGWTEVVVSDDGPGLPDMEAEVLETGEETPLNHGQGLGLWMVRMIVTQAGGDVSVEVAGDGTEVRLWLPAARTAER